MHKVYGVKSTAFGTSEESETLVEFKDDSVLRDVENVFKENLWVLILFKFVNINKCKKI